MEVNAMKLVKTLFWSDLEIDVMEINCGSYASS